MLHALAFATVLFSGLYFVILAAVALFAPTRAEAFLLGFAKTAQAHWIELALRFVVGAAFVLHAPQSRYTAAFSLAGWMLMLTTAGLVVVPWRWHRVFAQRAVPYATRYLSLIGIVSLVLGALVIAAALTGRSA